MSTKRIDTEPRMQGLECKTITGGGTGTYLLEASSGVFTEIQPGSYIFNDADYARNLNADGESGTILFDRAVKRSPTAMDF